MTKRSEVLWLVIKDMTDREEKGFKTYNNTMDRKDLSELEWLNHAYEEALDLSLYLKKIILIKQQSL
jgi:hypothetical protein